MGMNTSSTREMLKTRYARIRARLVANNGSVDHIPSVGEVSEAQWDADEKYLARMREKRSFTFTQLTNEHGVHPEVATGTVAYWTKILINDWADEDGETVDVIREATEAEIIDFVMDGGIEDEDEGDREFDAGWNAYGECA